VDNGLEGPTHGTHKKLIVKRKKTPCKGQQVEIVLVYAVHKKYFRLGMRQQKVVPPVCLFTKIKSEGASSSPSETKQKIRVLEKIIPDLDTLWPQTSIPEKIK
jgi:hypothetical protein